MQLNEKGLQGKKVWENKGYKLPQYNRTVVMATTKEHPFWIHFGAGNIFRAFQANVIQNLLNSGLIEKGLIVAEGFDYEIIEKMNRLHDDYTILVTLKADGTMEKTVIGSIVESCILDSENRAEYKRLQEIFCKESLQICSFTITEKGYSLTDAKGNWLSMVESDFMAGPKRPNSYIGKVTSLLYTRFQNGQLPIAMVSMDNCSHNGDKLYEAIHTFAEKWVDNGLVEKSFTDYIKNRDKVSFPWSMIDKITPRPDVSVEAILKKDGVEGLEAVVTSKNTYVAPFVNAEECEYLVVEDWFPNGRPKALEQGGIFFTDRETVDKVEKMKVCTCLNPLHTALAIFGCLLGYEKISEEMKDENLRRLVERIGYEEGLPVVVDPKILNPKEFIDTVLNIRIPNPFMPDTPQRIATDTSQKLAIRFGETIKKYLTADDKTVADLNLIPLVFAGWLRYLMGIDDNGNKFELSPDPLLDILYPIISNIEIGDKQVEERIRPLLKKKEIFGVDLYEVGLAEKVVGYFEEMIAKEGAVRETLNKYV